MLICNLEEPVHDQPEKKREGDVKIQISLLSLFVSPTMLLSLRFHILTDVGTGAAALESVLATPSSLLLLLLLLDAE